MKTLTQVAGVLVLVGALNWGLVGLFGLNVVSAVLGQESFLEKVVYDLVGLSAVWMVWEMYAKPKGKK